MSKFEPNSRYIQYAQLYATTDRRGRTVQALTPAEIPPQTLLGEHQRKQGQRLDHLAAHYLADPFGYWRLAHIGDAMSPDVLTDAPLIKIPTKR